jgi:hypothetical protein
MPREAHMNQEARREAREAKQLRKEARRALRRAAKRNQEVPKGSPVTDIAPPPIMHPNILARMRAVPPLEPFDEVAALARMQRISFLRSIHGPVNDPALSAEWAEHNARVAQYAAVKPPPPPAAAPPPVTAFVPRPPRAPAPTAWQPSPALAGATRRAGLSQAATVLSALWGVSPPTLEP